LLGIGINTSIVFGFLGQQRAKGR